MKPVKNLVFAALLVFSLAFNTFAGDIDVPGRPEPPPKSITAETDETIPATTSTDTEETMIETADALFFEILAALLSVY